jgi:hypothetical protein
VARHPHPPPLPVLCRRTVHLVLWWLPDPYTLNATAKVFLSDLDHCKCWFRTAELGPSAAGALPFSRL